MERRLRLVKHNSILQRDWTQVVPILINHLSRLDIESTCSAMMFYVTDELIRRGLRFGNREARGIDCTM
jgi:hypothetical protein